MYLMVMRNECMNNEILKFIKRRFRKDCDWTDGNCYYFALILKDRFPEGKIFYDVLYGHFVFQYQDKYYDWTGIADSLGDIVEWDKFEEFDSVQKKRIIRDCIM